MTEETIVQTEERMQRAVAAHKPGIEEHWYYWPMIFIGVMVTGTMTFAAARRGMASSALWSEWVDFAAFLTVLVIEGSAIALTYGHQNWFRSTAQRQLATQAGWSVWIVLALTTVASFARNAGGKDDHGIDSLLSWHTSYFLPLSIVVLPMVAKRLYELRPESQMRISIQETEGQLMDELVKIKREQNAIMIQGYRNSLTTGTAKAAIAESFEKLAVHRARKIAAYTADIEWPDEIDLDPKAPRR